VGLTGTAEGIARARAVKLGMDAAHVEWMTPFVRLMRRAGIVTPADMAAEMTLLKLPTRTGVPWTAAQVARLLARIGP